MLKIALVAVQLTAGLRTAIASAAGLPPGIALQPASANKSTTCALAKRTNNEPPRPACKVSAR